MFTKRTIESTTYVAIFIFFLTVGHSPVQADYDCEAEFDNVEKCFQQLVMVGKQLDLNKESAKMICNSQFEAVSCIYEYKAKCIKGVASMVFNLMSKKFNATFNHLCSNEDAMEEFIEHFNCLRGSLETDNMKRCYAQYQLRLEMTDNVQKADKFPIICCSWFHIRQCTAVEMRNGCKNEQSIEYMDNMVTKFVGDLNKMFCMDWKTPELCKQNTPPEIAAGFEKIDAMDLATAEGNKKFKSFLRFLKHMIESAQ